MLFSLLLCLLRAVLTCVLQPLASPNQDALANLGANEYTEQLLQWIRAERKFALDNEVRYIFNVLLSEGLKG